MSVISAVIAARRARAIHHAIRESPHSDGGPVHLRAAFPDPSGQGPLLEDDLVVTVVLTAVHSGVPLLPALDVAGRNLGALHGEQLRRFVAQVSAGASWDEAAAATNGIVESIVVALAPAWHQGASARSALVRLAGQSRDASSALAVATAAQLGVRLVLPLGLCFLPAFVLIGLVPLGIGLAVPQ